jgi:protein SCO1
MKKIFGAILSLILFSPVSHSEEMPNKSIYQLESTWITDKNIQLPFSKLAGRPRLIAMVYTKCRAACPLLVGDIKRVQGKLRPETRDRINIDLFSFDSVSENQKTLEEFMARYGINGHWTVYRSQKDNVSELAALLGVQYKQLADGEYIHSNSIFLVNAKGEIIHRQDGLGGDLTQFIQKIQETLDQDR